MRRLHAASRADSVLAPGSAKTAAGAAVHPCEWPRVPGEGDREHLARNGNYGERNHDRESLVVVNTETADDDADQSDDERYEQHKGRAARKCDRPNRESDYEGEDDTDTLGEALTGNGYLQCERERVETDRCAECPREGNARDPTLERECLIQLRIDGHANRMTPIARWRDGNPIGRYGAGVTPPHAL